MRIKFPQLFQSFYSASVPNNHKGLHPASYCNLYRVFFILLD